MQPQKQNSDSPRSWYVLKTTYNREQKMADMLIRHGFHAYVAQKYKWTRPDGDEEAELESIIPNVLFAYLSHQELMSIFSGSDSAYPTLTSGVSYIRSSATKENSGHPISISDSEMQNFILATSTHDKNIIVLNRGNYTLKSDNDVQVTVGPYKGVCGKLIRAQRQQRVLVSLPHLISIGTPYIPTNCLQELNP